MTISGISRSQSTSSEEKIDFVEQIPYELVSEIFSYLPKEHLIRCSLVSKGWNFATEDPHLWYEKARLKAWMQYAKGNEGQNYDLDFIHQLDQSQKQTINKWLLRLSETCDFRKDQSQLANIVCSMLETLKQNKEFKELFFDQVEANNECCHDRAAMALNEIYSCWKLYTLDKETSVKDKLSLLAGIAKTNALRMALSKALEKRNISESVEIYLYYETLLKDELGLVTAINNAAYAAMGNCSWIEPNDLQEVVQNTYLEILVQLPSFEKVASQDPSYAAKKMEIVQRYDAYIDRGYGAFQLQAPRENELINLGQEWVKENLSK